MTIRVPSSPASSDVVVPTGLVSGGVVDNAAAIQAAIDSATGDVGSKVFIPAGTYKVGSTLTLRSGSELCGVPAGMDRSDAAKGGTILDFSTVTNANAIAGIGNGGPFTVRDLYLKGPGAATATDSAVGGAVGIWSGDYAKGVLIENVHLSGFSNQIVLQSVAQAVVTRVLGQNARNHGLVLRFDCVGVQVTSSLFQVVNASGNASAGTKPSNIFFQTLSGRSYRPTGIIIDIPEQDEVAHTAGNTTATVWMEGGVDVLLRFGRLYVPVGSGAGSRYGVIVGQYSDRVTLQGGWIGPYTADGTHVPTYCVLVEANAADTRLVGVTTDANGGGHISDLGTRTRINGAGTEAAGVGGTPTAANWSVGDVVHNSDDNTVWWKDPSGTFRKLL